MKYDLIIRGGTVVREDRVERTDIAIENEKIVEIAPQLPGDARETIDAAGLHVFPGVIDPHVHFNEPGRTEWEGFATGSAALAAGGGTLFFDMPLNSSPPVLDAESFDLKLEAAKRSSLTDFALWGGLTPKNLDRMEELAERGVVGFKAFMCDSGIEEFPYADDETLQAGMNRAASLGLPVAVHAEDQATVQKLTDAALRAHRCDAASFSRSRPIEAETLAVRRAIELAVKIGCKLHIVHISSAEAITHVLATRIAAGIIKHSASISGETCPHYLYFSEEDLETGGPLLKCAPPLRSREQVVKLMEQVSMFHFIASDHSPCLPAMKENENFFRAWGGIAGVQSTLPVLLTVLPEAPLNTIAKLTAGNAARRFGIIGKGELLPAFDADLSLVSLEQYTLKREQLLDRHKLSPYVGRTFRGVIRRTILRGRTIFMNGNVVAPPAGRFVRPVR